MKRMMKRMISISLLIATASLAGAPAVFAADNTAATAGSEHPVSDAWIKSKIVGEYAVNPHVSALKLDVKVENGIAHLGGTANTSTERDLAIEIARGTEGVREVRSQIALKPTTAQAEKTRRTAGETIDDATITATVKTKLIGNAAPAKRINVTTRNGIVTLTGTVESDAQKDLAGRTAENTEHVKEVHNELTVAHR